MDLSRNSTTNSLKIELAKCKAENSKLKKEAAETIKEEFKELGKIAQCRLKFKALEKKHENQINSLKDELETFQKRLTIINEENRLQEEKNEQLRRQGQYLRIQCEQNKTLIESFYDDNNKLELKKIELETAVEQLQAELARHQEELRTTIIGENLRKTDLEIAAFQNEIKMKDEIWQGHLIELSRINSQAEDSELEFAHEFSDHEDLSPNFPEQQTLNEEEIILLSDEDINDVVKKRKTPITWTFGNKF